MPVPLGVRIGLRYLGKPEGGHLSGASVAAITGLALGVAVLILVMAVMNGFRLELSKRLLGTIPHVEAVNVDLLQIPVPAVSVLGVQDGGRFLRFESLIKPERAPGYPVTVFAVEPSREANLSIIPDHIVAGRWQSLTEVSQNLSSGKAPALILSRPLARYLRLSIGDPVKLLVLDQPADISVPRPRQLSFTLTALFEIGAQVDYGLAFIAVEDALQFVPPSAYRGGWRFRLEDAMTAPDKVQILTKQISNLTGLTVDVKTWADTFGTLFQAVHLEKRIMFLLLLLIVLIATTGVASAQVLAVDQKRSAIAILRTMGMGRAGIASIFLVQALVISFTGIATGSLCGLLLADHIGGAITWAERSFGFQMLPGTYFDQLPARWQWDDLMLIIGSAFILTLASTLYPALSASRLQPVAALNLSDRY